MIHRFTIYEARGSLEAIQVLRTNDQGARRLTEGHQGPPGPPGPAGSQQFWEAENASGATIQAGQPVWVAPGGVAQLASAADNTKPAAGLAAASVASSVSGDYQTAGHLTLANWTAATGATNLTPGAYYWLSATAGQLTTTPPAGSGRSLQRVGQALSASTLAIQIIRYARRA